MEACGVCNARALYKCKSCQMLCCKEHKFYHEESNMCQHMFERTGIKLDPQQISKIRENLSLKIKTANHCIAKILQETTALIEDIQLRCVKAIKNVKEYEERCENLLRMCRHSLSTEQIREIESEAQYLCKS